MKKSNLKSLKGISAVRAPLEVENVRVLGAAPADGEASPFGGMFQPDDWRAYIEFDVCHSFPQVIGPTRQGSIIGFTPAVLAASHGSLIHQQLNLRHLIKAYDPQNITRDRIIGCIVACSFPRAPFGGWKIPATAEEAPCIHACAVVFKLAEGVAAMLGKHQTSTQKQSVSMETWAEMGDIGLYDPRSREVWSMEDAPDELLAQVSMDDGRLRVGKLGDGTQPALAYGIVDTPISFRGVGMTPNPAERTARVTAVMAERENENVFAVAAERVDDMLVGQVVAFNGGRALGRVRRLVKQGRLAAPHGYGIMGSAEDPALLLELPDGGQVVKHMSQIG